MTQSGDVLQREAEHVFSIDLRHYAKQHHQRIILNQEPEQQKLTTERGFNALLSGFEEFPNASCIIWIVQ